MSNDQSVFHGEGRAWTFGWEEILIFEKFIQEVWWSRLISNLRNFFFNFFGNCSWFTLVLFSSFCSSFRGFLFGSNFLSSWFWRLNFNLHLWVSLSFNSLNKQFGFLICKIKPELMITNILIADKSMLLWLWE